MFQHVLPNQKKVERFHGFGIPRQGGPQPSQDSLGFKGSAILQDEEVYMFLKTVPSSKHRKDGC